MKLLLLTMFTFSFLNADYLMLYKGTNYCIKSYTILDSTPTIKVVLSSDNSTANISLNPINNIFNGYVYDNVLRSCNFDVTSQALGITYNQYNFLYALLGVIFGSIFLFFFIHMIVRR